MCARYHCNAMRTPMHELDQIQQIEHIRGPTTLPSQKKFTHYEVQTVRKRAVGIRLKYLLVL